MPTQTQTQTKKSSDKQPGSLRRLFKELFHDRWLVIVSVIFTLLIGLTEVVTPRLMGDVTNGIARDLEAATGIQFDRVIEGCLILVGVYLLQGAFVYVQSRVLTRMSQGLIFRMREAVSLKIRRIPLSYYDSQRTGDLLSRMTNDVEVLGKNIQHTISQVFYGVVILTGMLVMMLRISVVLTLVFFITIPLSFVATRFITSRSQRYFRAKSKGLGTMVSYVEESFTGTDLIKAYNYEDEADREFAEHNDALFEVSYRASFMAGALTPIMTFISNLGYVMIAIGGGLLVVAQQIMIGDVLAFIQYSRKIQMPINQVADMANLLQETIAAADRVYEFLDAPEEVETVSAQITPPVREITFDQVSFQYESGQPIIQDLNLEVQEGETVAIVGPTGAGKTTLVNLLLRFYELTGGAIRINGVDIRQVSRANLRQLFGMVLQDAWLFQGTIAENIRYGNLEATDEEVRQAARQAYCYHFIESLPEGFDTVIKEDASNLSQGQRQLLTIARALLSDPEILILDEATSSVDTRTERMIQKAMNRLMAGRTNFVIAHRLSTIVGADIILVLDQGQIVEQGNHETLMAQQGTYYQLYQAQFKE